MFMLGVRMEKQRTSMILLHLNKSWLRITNVNPVHNAPRLSVMRPGIQVDRARREGWGRERSVTDRPGPALPDFNLTRPGTPEFQPDPARHSRISTDRARHGGVGEGEVCYRQTRPDFSPATSPASPFPHPSKPPSQTQRLTELIYTSSTGNR
jgi:hypothetical protein